MKAHFLEAAVERLIPGDANGPGATDAGVAAYIDKQLGGAWGAGERLYRSGSSGGGVNQGSAMSGGSQGPGGSGDSRSDKSRQP